jgi:hypothetical protein
VGVIWKKLAVIASHSCPTNTNSRPKSTSYEDSSGRRRTPSAPPTAGLSGRDSPGACGRIFFLAGHSPDWCHTRFGPEAVRRGASFPLDDAAKTGRSPGKTSACAFPHCLLFHFFHMSNKPGRGGKVFEWDLFVRPALIILMRGGARPPIRLIFSAAANEGSGRKTRRSWARHRVARALRGVQIGVRVSKTFNSWLIASGRLTMPMQM